MPALRESLLKGPDVAETPELTSALAKLNSAYGVEAGAEHLFAHMPAATVAYGELMLTLESTATLPKELLYLIAITSSKVAKSPYVHARYIVRAEQEGLAREKIDATECYESSPLFNEAERLAMRFAARCSESPSAARKPDFSELLRFFDQDEVTEILALVCVLSVLQRFSNAVCLSAETP